MPSISVKNSLENPEWVGANYDFLRKCFAEEYIQADMNFFMRFGWQLKLHGVEWHDYNDIPNFLGKYHNSKIFDAEFKEGKLTGLIRRYPATNGIQPSFVHPKDVVRASAPTLSPSVAPAINPDIIDVVVKERDMSAATKLINLVRSRIK